eukprot:COSAG04_NODE_1805_length_5534_cov_3.875989_3_plen_56_part_00
MQLVLALAAPALVAGEIWDIAAPAGAPDDHLPAVTVPPYTLLPQPRDRPIPRRAR